MKKNRVIPVLISALAVIVLVLLATFGPQLVSGALAAENVKLTDFSAEEACAYRWEAIANFFNPNPYAGVDLTTLSADDVMAYRWIGMAEAYSK